MQFYITKELLTASYAKIFHDQFAALLERRLNYVEESSQLRVERNELKKERKRLDAISQPKHKPDHRMVFVMLPFKGYDSLESALRRVAEDEWASNFTWLATRLTPTKFARMFGCIWGSRTYCSRNPNVKYELGAARYGVRERPILLLCKTPAGNVKPQLPADLQGLLYNQYDENLSASDLALFFDDEFRKKDSLQTLITEADRKRFVSVNRLEEILHTFSWDDSVFARLAASFPTVDAWRQAKEADVARELNREDAEMAQVVVQRVKKQFVT